MAAITRTSTVSSLRPPNRRNFPFLENAQELHLRRRRHLGDLVEEERPVIGQFEAAGASIHGAGKRSLLVTEDLAFEECFGDGRAIDRDERHLRAD